MEIKELQKIKIIKINLRKKLMEEEKTLKWFWENKIIGTGLAYYSFMGNLNGNGSVIRPDIEAVIQEYMDEK